MSQGERAAKQDELLVRAAEAVNRGELKDAHVLAGLVLADDQDNLDASTLLATESQPAGEVRRLTVMFCDLVGSTSLSGRLDPELYRSVLSRYRRLAAEIAVDRHGGFVTGFQGDGMLALFGYPTMIRVVGLELAAASPALDRMLSGLRTTATVALQLWLREDEPALGWGRPGMTVSAFERPLSTWASMPQLIAVEDWPVDDQPGAIAYFCGAIDAPWPPDRPWPEYLQQHLTEAHASAEDFIEKHLPHLLPGLRGPDGIRWDLLCGWDGIGDPLRSQFIRVNVDPSDRYVMCVPGSDHLRLRSDESGFDNLWLAGDWTDNGINAGCIEAAVVSGLQAANAIVGRARQHRITGIFPP